MSGTAPVHAGASGNATVERGVNEARTAAFAVILATALGIGLAVGFATDMLLGVLAAVGAAVGTAVLLVVVYRVRPVGHAVMELMHRITGQ